MESIKRTTRKCIERDKHDCKDIFIKALKGDKTADFMIESDGQRRGWNRTPIFGVFITELSY